MASVVAIWKWPAIFVLLTGAYVLFVGSFSLSEVFAAAPAVLGGFGFALLMSRNAARPLRVRAPWPRILTRVSGALVMDTGRVGLALLRSLARPVTGVASVQRFAPGGSGAQDSGRRAVVILATSLAPNGFVMRVKPDALLVHQLVPAPAGEDLDWKP